MAELKFKAPKTLAEAADRMYATQQARYKQQKVVDALQAEETFLKDHLINNLPKSQASGIAGKLARATIKMKEIAQLQDFDKFMAYVSKSKRYDLLQRRVSAEAVKEMWAAGKSVPGVELFKAPTVSLNKV